MCNEKFSSTFLLSENVENSRSKLNYCFFFFQATVCVFFKYIDTFFKKKRNNFSFIFVIGNAFSVQI